jgi:hypothetical protein
MRAFFDVVLVILAVVIGAIGCMVVVYAGAIIAIVCAALFIGWLIIFCATEYVKYKRDQ